MIHLSSYHSNGLPAVVWSNRVNLIGEKVYKPKIHFCEQCNKPILIYGRLIPCKHVFCYTCATQCASSPTSTPHQQQTTNERMSRTSLSPTNPYSNPNGGGSSNSSGTKCCYRCAGRVIRVERNTLNSIFVCQVETCKRTYLSARDLQAHVSHRHSKKKNAISANSNAASVAAISASPYISQSSLAHINSGGGGSSSAGGIGSHHSSHRSRHNDRRSHLYRQNYHYHGH